MIQSKLEFGAIRRRLAVSLTAVVAAAALLSCVSAGSSLTAPAKAEFFAAHFCNGWLSPAWTGNYRCDAPDNVSGYNRENVFIATPERAGCVDYADVWHNLMASWVCYGKGANGGISVRRDGGWYRGVIRNNNTSYGGNFVGTVTWNQ
jgi:hypothetical protein